MAADSNQYVSNWLAAFCGDEEYLFPRAVETIKQSTELKTETGWPLIDVESQSHQMLKGQFPRSIANLAPSPTAVTVVTTLETASLRATLIPMSELQFQFRGFLADLAEEQRFADVVLTSLSQHGAATPLEPELEVAGNRVMADRTPSYAGTASVVADSFAGEVIFGDFACFELQAVVTNRSNTDWASNLRRDLQALLESLTPITR
jgi:hypothetical protein